MQVREVGALPEPAALLVWVLLAAMHAAYLLVALGNGHLGEVLSELEFRRQHLAAGLGGQGRRRYRRRVRPWRRRRVRPQHGVPVAEVLLVGGRQARLKLNDFQVFSSLACGVTARATIRDDANCTFVDARLATRVSVRWKVVR